jgi:hypothetical protein
MENRIFAIVLIDDRRLKVEYHVYRWQRVEVLHFFRSTRWPGKKYYRVLTAAGQKLTMVEGEIEIIKNQSHLEH